MGDPDGSGPSTSSPKPLASLDQADTNTIRELKEKLNDIRHLLANEELADYREIEQLSQMVERTTKKVSDIEEFRVQNPGRVIRHAAFYSVNEVDMKNLGLHTIKIVDGVAEAFDDIMQPSFKSAFDRLLSLPKLRHSLMNCSYHPDTMDEIGSRMLVNRWMLEVSDICDQMHIHLVLQPNLLLCGIDQTARIDFQNHTTLLTHHPDYATNSYEDRNKAYAKGELRTIGVECCYADTKDTILVLEAMSQKTPLEKFIPQAVARCLVLMGSRGNGVVYMGFSLTSGIRWIFGVADRISGVCYRTPELQMDLKKEGPSNIMKHLFYWSTVRNHHILTKLRESSQN